MDEWIEQNPRATLYILAVSIFLIIVLTGFLWYYTTSQEYMKMVDRELLKEVVEHVRNGKKKPATNLTEMADDAKNNKKSEKDDKKEEDGENDFTIVDA